MQSQMSGLCIVCIVFLFPLLFMYIDIGVFYKLRDKERSKESAYVLVGFLACPFVSFVSHIVN